MMFGLRKPLRALLLMCSLVPIMSLAETANVAAASNMQFALQEIAARYQKDSGHSLRLVFGSSGNLYRQISQGAPFQLFLSADEAYVQQLAAAGKTLDEGVLYGLGRIALMAPKGSSLTLGGELQGLTAALAEGQIKKFAIANPEHAPYGRAAEQALQHAGLWDALQGKLVLGENIAQAAQFATSGNAQGGMVAYSLALAPGVAERGEFVLIPSVWHQPLRQRMVLLKGASASAQAFYQYLQQPAARAIMTKYGFDMPEAG
ncbi:molybdate ABC transporter substrate-binding protein [Pseudomonas sp. XK-1]|uniref:molybdate ABC transporter substrate-binding protein n=1 Tax=Pseudomonas sp. XK-1 TaxID=3136019 RepID=UPI00311A6016